MTPRPEPRLPAPAPAAGWVREGEGEPLALSERAPAGCLAAVMTAAVLPVLVVAVPILIVFTLPVAAAHALLLAVPLYVIVARRYRPGIALTLASGFLIGAAPTLLLTLFLSPPDAGMAGILLGGAESSEALWSGLLHWGQYLAPALILGICGLAGGLVFWLVALWGDEN